MKGPVTEQPTGPRDQSDFWDSLESKEMHPIYG
jgi:hypothetical protein